MRYWKTKEFTSRKQMNKWIEKHGKNYQWEEIFINNGFGIEYRKLLKIG